MPFVTERICNEYGWASFVLNDAVGYSGSKRDERREREKKTVFS